MDWTALNHSNPFDLMSFIQSSYIKCYHSTTHTLFLEAILVEDMVDIKAKEVGVRGVAKPIINTYLALSPHVITVAKEIT